MHGAAGLPDIQPEFTEVKSCYERGFVQYLAKRGDAYRICYRVHSAFSRVRHRKTDVSNRCINPYWKGVKL